MIWAIKQTIISESDIRWYKVSKLHIAPLQKNKPTRPWAEKYKHAGISADYLDVGQSLSHLSALSVALFVFCPHPISSLSVCLSMCLSVPLCTQLKGSLLPLLHCSHPTSRLDHLSVCTITCASASYTCATEITPEKDGGGERERKETGANYFSAVLFASGM